MPNDLIFKTKLQKSRSSTIVIKIILDFKSK
jgi:hypothetical protein